MKKKYEAENASARYGETSKTCRAIRRGLVTAVATFALAAAGTASAAIMLTSGNSPQSGQQNVLFNGEGTVSGPALVVTGRTNQSDTLVAFESDENLVTPANGQARVDAEDDFFDNLSVYLLGGGAFTSLIFNLDATANGAAVITVGQVSGPNRVFDVTLNGSGQNFFTLVATDGQLMTRVDVATAVSIALADAQQFRIGIAEANGEIPEPSALWLAGLGLLGLAGMRKVTRQA